MGGFSLYFLTLVPHAATHRVRSPQPSAQRTALLTGGKTHALRLITWPPTTAFTTTAASLPLTHCPCCRHHRQPQPFRPRPCSCTCCRVLLAVKCARTCAHTYLHIKWDSKVVRTPPLVCCITVITSTVKEQGQRTLFVHTLHQRPAPPPRDLERAAARSLRLPGQTSRLYARCEC